MVTNAHDEAVSNSTADRLAEIWRKSGANHIQTFCFPDELGIPHSCIDVEAPNGKPELVYAELMKMVG